MGYLYKLIVRNFGKTNNSVFTLGGYEMHIKNNTYYFYKTRPQTYFDFDKENLMKVLFCKVKYNNETLYIQSYSSGNCTPTQINGNEQKQITKAFKELVPRNYLASGCLLKSEVYNLYEKQHHHHNNHHH